MADRIDVIKGEKKKFKVMLNFVQWGAALSSFTLANSAAANVQKSYPHASLHLYKE